MKLLAIAAALDRVHHDVLRCHEGKLPAQTLLHHLRINHKTVGNIAVQIENGVYCQECLRHADALVRGVVQCSLKPLGRSGHCRVEAVGNHIASQGRHALGAHGIALISHRRGTDLVLLKRLLHLLEMLKQADIVGEFRGALGDPTQNGQDLAVQLTGIRLTGNGKAGRIAHLLCNLPIQLTHLFIITIKQLQEACLRSRRSLGAKQLGLGKLIFHVFQVHQQILNPERCTLADRRGLRGLKMREGQRRLILMLLREAGQCAHDKHQLLLHQVERFRHNDNIRVISHIAGCSAEMNDRLSLRTLHAISVNMGHDIVADFLFPCPGNLIIDVVLVSRQLIDLLLGDGKPQFMLCLRQSNPKLAPGAEFFLLREEIFHLFIRITGGKRRFIICMHTFHAPFFIFQFKGLFETSCAWSFPSSNKLQG